MTPDQYVASGKHLPLCFRDHSSASEVFRAIHGLMDFSGEGYGRNTDVVEGHCYVIDMFLWFMAKRGYTLQKSRAKVDFRDLDDDVQGYIKREHESFMTALKNELARTGGERRTEAADA